MRGLDRSSGQRSSGRRQLYSAHSIGRQANRCRELRQFAATGVVSARRFCIPGIWVGLVGNKGAESASLIGGHPVRSSGRRKSTIVRLLAFPIHLVFRLGRKIHHDIYRFVFPAKAGIHRGHGHRPSPVRRDYWCRGGSAVAQCILRVAHRTSGRRARLQRRPHQ